MPCDYWAGRAYGVHVLGRGMTHSAYLRGKDSVRAYSTSQDSTAFDRRGHLLLELGF